MTQASCGEWAPTVDAAKAHEAACDKCQLSILRSRLEDANNRISTYQEVEKEQIDRSNALFAELTRLRAELAEATRQRDEMAAKLAVVEKIVNEPVASELEHASQVARIKGLILLVQPTFMLRAVRRNAAAWALRECARDESEHCAGVGADTYWSGVHHAINTMNLLAISLERGEVEVPSE